MARMNRLEDIGIEVHTSAGTESGLSANVLAILHEIATMQAALVNDDTADGIDLRGLPLLPGEYDALKTVLGKGDLSATIDALGETLVYETQVTGVWWVQHNNRDGERIAELIEVTRIPEIMKSNVRDIEDACTALREQLAEWRNPSANNRGEHNE
ncbi:MAG: hydrogenase expression/formation protein [Proteobacteria bacterium]|jgi:hydrogenase-1 operon protein HyaF|nr:hydrogenase expression/formation protein [Pseudomonadota bacterium]